MVCGPFRVVLAAAETAAAGADGGRRRPGPPMKLWRIGKPMRDMVSSRVVPMKAGNLPPMTDETVAVASDHGGIELKTLVCAELEKRGIRVLDLGTDTTDSVDYPDFALKLAEAMKRGEAARGVLICGTGIGISIAANRHTHIRAALVHDAFGARLSRQHNDANVLVLGGRTMGPEVAKDVLDIFLTTPFEGGRHERRVLKLAEHGER